MTLQQQLHHHQHHEAPVTTLVRQIQPALYVESPCLCCNVLHCAARFIPIDFVKTDTHCYLHSTIH